MKKLFFPFALLLALSVSAQTAKKAAQQHRQANPTSSSSGVMI